MVFLFRQKPALYGARRAWHRDYSVISVSCGSVLFHLRRPSGQWRLVAI